MSQRIKILTDMLFENIELLESYNNRVLKYENRRKEWLLKNPDRKEWSYSEPYPCVSTSKTNIKKHSNITKKRIIKFIGNIYENKELLEVKKQ